MTQETIPGDVESRRLRVDSRGVIYLLVFSCLAIFSVGDSHAIILRVSAENGCPVMAGSPPENGANKNWLDTTVVVPAVGAPLSLGVGGTIQVSPGGPNVLPTGDSPGAAGPGYCAPLLPAHSAIGCIGAACLTGGGVIFAIGVGAPAVPGIAAPAAGPLYVGVNDIFYDDNSGDWYGAFGTSPNVGNFYMIAGASDGVGWTFELTNPGAAPSGDLRRAVGGLAVGAPAAAFPPAFAAAIGSLALPNVVVIPFPAFPAMLVIGAPPTPGGIGSINLWVTPAGLPAGTPTLNAGGAGMLLPGVAFNPTIQAIQEPPAGSSGIPTASSLALTLMGVGIAAVGAWAVTRMRG